MAQADVTDTLADALRNLFGVGPAAIVSAAPGGGPEAEREDRRVLGGGPVAQIGSVIPKGADRTGYGGHGDAVILDDAAGGISAEVARIVDDHVRLQQRKGLRDVRPGGRLRFNKAFSIEGHIDTDWKTVAGPFSLYDGTVTAPAGGSSLVGVPIAFPTSGPSPIELLMRYPGALFFQIFVHSFSWVPTGTTMTGLQELYFQDIGGARRGLGVYPAASQTAGVYTGIGTLLTSPLTDPGDGPLGTLYVNNIGIGGTPVSSYYQLNLAFVAAVPDPWFNEQMIVPPRPAEIAQALSSMGAGGQ